MGETMLPGELSKTTIIPMDIESTLTLVLVRLVLPPF